MMTGTAILRSTGVLQQDALGVFAGLGSTV